MPLYGSSRLGEWRPRRLLDIAAQENTVTTASGEKTYELANHLGNVLAVVSDALIDDAPSVVSATDYYAFGQEMVGRTFASEDYRYGFNGKERDDDFWGEGNAYDFGARINDPRLGRWLSLDPLMAKYPNMSPYCSMGNNPIVFIDPDGRDIIVSTKQGQLYFYAAMVEAFGSKALNDFIFDDKGNLSFNGNVENYTLEEQTVQKSILSIIDDKTIKANVIFSSEINPPVVIKSNDGKKENDITYKSTDKTGGEAVVTAGYIGDIKVYVDPDTYALFTVEGKIEKLNVDGEVTGYVWGDIKVSLSRYSRLFHGLGHLVGKVKDKSQAMELENAAGKIHKDVKFDKADFKLSEADLKTNKPSILKDKKGNEKIKPDAIEERKDDKGHPAPPSK